MENIQRGGFGIKVSKRCLFDPVTGVSGVVRFVKLAQ